MPWFKVDDGFPTSKPVLRIPRRHRASAIGLWTLAGAWSAKELTDGHIEAHLLDEFGSTAAMARQLVTCGLWEVADNGWQFRHWAKYQPTRAQVLADREREAERKRAYRERKATGESQGSPTRSVAVSTTSDRNGKKRPSVAPGQDVNLSDLHEPEMSQRDTSGTEMGRTVGHQAESGRPDPTRPDPTHTSTDVDVFPADAGAPNTATLIGEWIDHCDERPPGRVIGQVSKEVKTMLDEGLNYERVRNGLAEWNRKGLHPSTIASVVHEVANKQAKPSNGDVDWDAAHKRAVARDAQTRGIA